MYNNNDYLEHRNRWKWEDIWFNIVEWVKLNFLNYCLKPSYNPQNHNKHITSNSWLLIFKKSVRRSPHSQLLLHITNDSSSMTSLQATEYKRGESKATSNQSHIITWSKRHCLFRNRHLLQWKEIPGLCAINCHRVDATKHLGRTINEEVSNSLKTLIKTINQIN